MGLLRYLLFLGLVFGRFEGLTGQFYFTGEPPASVKWEKIRTESFKVIFPAGMYEQANRFANRLEYYKNRTVDLSFDRHRSMPVIMQGMSVLSNGYVSWTPDRMEIVPLPPQDSYAQDWLTQLAVHEYRHVAQLHSLGSGFTRGLSFLSGQIATGITTAMVPMWLYEGDAVLQETKLTHAGRGRSSTFEMPLRTLLLSGEKTWSYDKAFFGSYRDFVPDHYKYGYQIAAYAQARYGGMFWPEAFDFTGRNMFLVTPLYFYLKKQYGISKSQLYHLAMDSARIVFNRQKDSVHYTEYSLLSTGDPKYYENNILPQYAGRDRIVFMRSGIDRLDRFILRDAEGKETVLKTPGITRGVSLSAADGLLVWDEVVRDSRWAKRSYSEIRLLDLNTGRTKFLAKRTRYFSPDISSDGNEIVVVETDLNGNHNLVILNATTGEIARSLPSPGNAELQTPAWSENGRIVAVMVSGEGKVIAEADPLTGTWEVILPPTRYNIAEPVPFQDQVFFRSNYTGIANLFALDRNSGRIFQVTSSRHGAFHPDIDPEALRIVYSDYSEKGFVLAEINIDKALWQVVEVEKLPPVNAIFSGPEEEATVPEPDIPAFASDYRYETEPYRKTWNALRFHSWIPLYTNVPDEISWNDLQVYPGFMLFSQNDLETVISTIGYSYVNGSHILKPSIRWSGWFPVLELKGQIGHYNGKNLPGNESREFTSGISPNNRYEVKTYIPLMFSRGGWIKSIRPQLALQHEDGIFGTEEERFTDLDFLHSKLYLAAYKRLSYKDLYPRIGWEINASATFTPFNRAQLGEMYSAWTSLYLPGIGVHHHLYFYAGWQKQFESRYYLPLSQIRFPRGYPNRVSGTYTTVSANYALPLLYPDLSLSSLLYIKRFRAQLFFDYGTGTDILRPVEGGLELFSEKNASTGTELMMDFHALRFIFPLSAGVRTGYLLSREKMFLSFLFSISTSL